MFELRDVVGRGLDPEDESELVVHLDGSSAHMVLDPCSLNAGVEVVAQVALVVGVQLPAQEGGDILRFDGVNGGADDLIVQDPQVGLSLENNVGGIFHLHGAPVIGEAVLLKDRAVFLGEAI